MLEAGVPPLVQTVDAHRLVPVLSDELLSGLVPVRSLGSPRQRVLVRLRAPVEDVPLELVPEDRLDDRDRLHLAALREDRQTLGVVEVSEPNALESTLADASLSSRWSASPSRRSF